MPKRICDFSLFLKIEQSHEVPSNLVGALLVRGPFLNLRAREEDGEWALRVRICVGLLPVRRSYGRGVVPLFCKLSELRGYAAVPASLSVPSQPSPRGG